jgi:RNA polymerase sigma-70 factor, ECF subfamily
MPAAESMESVAGQGNSAERAARVARDREFAAVALPLMPVIARVAQALTGDASDADDLVQETYLRAYRHWHTFDLDSDCKHWMSAICRNAFLEQRRRDSRSTAVEDQELESLAAARLHNSARASGVDNMFSRLDLGPAIMQAIDALEPRYRDVVLLIDVEDFSYEQVSEVLEIPIGTVRSRLYRARRQLQEALIAYAIDAGFATAGPSAPAAPDQRSAVKPSTRAR